MQKFRSRAIYALLMVVLALVTGEIWVRINFGDPEDQFYIFPPNMERLFLPDPEITPGVSGPGRFITNSLGLRSREVSDQDRFRVLALGGSTTEGNYLDQDETWPSLLESKLATALPDSHPWVGNAGKSGTSSLHHRMQLEKLPAQIGRVNVAVVSLGVNDVFRAIGWSFPKDFPAEQHINVAFERIPKTHVGLERSALYRFVERIRAVARKKAEGVVQTQDGKWMEEMRRKRRNASRFVQTPVDISAYISSELIPNIVRMQEVSKQQGIMLVLVTQPVLWKNDLTPDEDRLIYTAGLGYHGDVRNTPSAEYYSPGALRQMMDAVNQAIRETSVSNGIPVIDAAESMAGKIQYYYDDCHLNEEGARQFSAVVFHGLMKAIRDGN